MLGPFIPCLCLYNIPQCSMMFSARQRVRLVLCHSCVTHRCVNNCDHTHLLLYIVYSRAQNVVQLLIPVSLSVQQFFA